MVRRTFSPARAWWLAVGPASTRTLGITKARPVASPAGSAARSAEDQRATRRHSREQPAPLVRLHGSGQSQTKQCAPFMKQQVNFQSSQVSASRQAAVALGAGFVSQFLEPAAVRNAAASFCLVRGGRQIRGRPAWSARSGLPSFFFNKVICPSGTLPVFPLPHTVLPNPSFKPSPNGGTPGPGCRYAVHFLHPGPGVPPSMPA